MTLFEKSGALGGRLSFSDYMVFKGDIRRYRDYLIHQVEKADNIEIRLNTEATREVLGDQWDVVIVAVGAAPFVPPIPGKDRENVFHAGEIFGQEEKLGEKIVIVGGGQVGCEETVYLQSMGKHIEVVEMASELIPEGKQTPEERFWTLFFMEHAFDMKRRDLTKAEKIDRVHIHVNSRCLEITDKGVLIENADGEKKLLCADSVILATGFRPDEQAKKVFEDAAFDVITIGDSLKAGDLLQTSSTGLYAAFRI